MKLSSKIKLIINFENCGETLAEIEDIEKRDFFKDPLSETELKKIIKDGRRTTIQKKHSFQI